MDYKLAEKFVRAWQTSPTLAVVAERVGMTTDSASVKASKFRALGVPLRHMPKQNKTAATISRLKTLAESLTVKP